MTTPAHFDDNGASLQAEEATYRRKAWTVLACALAAFWFVFGAVVWVVWL